MSLVMFPGVAKLGNICNRNNVSATMFHSLARPFRLKDHLLSLYASSVIFNPLDMFCPLITLLILFL